MRERELTDTHELTNRKVIKHGAGSSKIGSSRNLFFLKQEIDLIKNYSFTHIKYFENDIFGFFFKYLFFLFIHINLLLLKYCLNM